MLCHSFMVIPASVTSSSTGAPCGLFITTWFISGYRDKQLIFQTHPLTHFPNFSAVQTCFIPLCNTPEDADSCSSSQWDICIAGLFFIRSIFPSQRRDTLMSLKSHYGWGSAPAKTDFLWFCSGREEMREAKSLWSKIQMDMAGHEGNPLKCTAPRASFHHGGVTCLAVISKTQCDREMSKLESVTRHV